MRNDDYSKPIYSTDEIHCAVSEMTKEEVLNEYGETADSLCKFICDQCTANDAYCPSYCDTCKWVRNDRGDNR